ncbi:hypothetical protein [Azospirillum sp. TSH100]|uniref:hypothetical protein n=1 Tax=Azospirillum sp. TSH100 TaxID=652764 RepID=UPI0010AAC699|nr:hypothetical protein [Azospirillum sp. TSH100]QCG89356.1 hypothetical protein E6C72_16325 [Azospirillum sp. TSH100]
MNRQAILGLIASIAAIVGAFATIMASLSTTMSNKQIINGDNNTSVANVNGNVTIEKDSEAKKFADNIKHLLINFPRNNEKAWGNDDIFSFAEMDGKIVSVFDKLFELNGSIIYIRFSTYVGAGFGINDLPKEQKIKAGVLFDLGQIDGFGGDISNYVYGYQVKLDSYREKWGKGIEATLLFPKSGNAFFEVHYMKSMNFEGMARVKISGIQGSQFIEIIPVVPTDSMIAKYNQIKSKVGSLKNNEF